MNPMRVALVGLGSVAEVHVQVYQAMPEVEIVGGFDANPLHAASFGARHGVRIFDDLETLLDSQAVDLACILTPARFHEQIAIACARAGIHILCEKPLALSVEACDRMIRACQAAKVSLCYAASYRYLPAVAKAKQLIDAGEIGTVLVMRESSIGGSGIAGRHTMSATHYPAGGPGGSGMGLIDHGIHLVDVFSWFTGAAITRTVGRGNIAGQEQRPEFLALEFDGGAIGELLYEDGTFSSDLPTEGIFSLGSGWDIGGSAAPGQWQAHPGCIHVHGTRGSLRIFHYANALFLRTATGIRQVPLVGEGAPVQFKLQMQAFIATLRTGAPPPVPAEAGREACRVVLSVYQ